MRRAVTVAALLLAFAGCTGPVGPSAPSQPNLAGTVWRLAAFQPGDGRAGPITPAANEIITFEFLPDGALVLRIACNRGRGRWQAADAEAISFGPAAVTRALCPDARLERIVLDLAGLSRYAIVDGTLKLAPAPDGGTYRFTPERGGPAPRSP